MKGKQFATNLLTRLFAANKKQPRFEMRHNATPAHHLLLRRRPQEGSRINPVYRSVTACIY